MRRARSYGAPKRTRAQIACAEFMRATLTDETPATAEGFAAKVEALARGGK